MTDVYGFQITEKHEDLHKVSVNIAANYQQYLDVNTVEVLMVADKGIFQ
jgi:hypothetical protein